jgi:hypothetical protein
MIDPFVLLTPILLLAVMALLRFVGCDWVLGLQSFIQDPIFNPPQGTYAGPQIVTVSSVDPDESFYYTTDGTDPVAQATTSSTFATQGTQVPLSRTTILKAIAVKDSDTSGITVGTYAIGPIAFVQYTEFDGAINNNTMITSPFTQPVSSGNLMVVVVRYNNPALTVLSVGDSAGNTYFPVSDPPAVSGPGMIANQQQGIWYAKKINGGGPNFTVTVILSGTAANPGGAVIAHEYFNADPDNPVDQQSAATGSTANASSGGANTTLGRLIFGAAIFFSSGSSATGFNQHSSSSSNVTEDIAITTLPFSAEALFSNGPTDWIAQMVTFK